MPSASTGSYRARGPALVTTEGGACRLAPEAPLEAASRPLTVLEVEDTAVNRDLVDPIRMHQGHTVLNACNGIEALEALEMIGFDLVVMVRHMPGMDGVLVKPLDIDALGKALRCRSG